MILLHLSQFYQLQFGFFANDCGPLGLLFMSVIGEEKLIIYTTKWFADDLLVQHQSSFFMNTEK